MVPSASGIIPKYNYHDGIFTGKSGSLSFIPILSGYYNDKKNQNDIRGVLVKKSKTIKGNLYKNSIR